MPREVVFSEGRGLRARKNGADANRGMSSRPTSWRETGGQKGGDLVVGAMPSSAGVRSPPLRGMAKRRPEGLTGADPKMARQAVFSEGRTLCVRVVRPDASRGTT